MIEFLFSEKVFLESAVKLFSEVFLADVDCFLKRSGSLVVGLLDVGIGTVEVLLYNVWRSGIHITLRRCSIILFGILGCVTLEPVGKVCNDLDFILLISSEE